MHHLPPTQCYFRNICDIFSRIFIHIIIDTFLFCCYYYIVTTNNVTRFKVHINTRDERGQFFACVHTSSYGPSSSGKNVLQHFFPLIIWKSISCVSLLLLWNLFPEFDPILSPSWLRTQWPLLCHLSGKCNLFFSFFVFSDHLPYTWHKSTTATVAAAAAMQ